MRKKILVVDDEDQIAELIANRLRAAGYAALTAGSAEEGLLRTKEERPDLILLDILMPKRDGHETLRELKRSPETRQIPVIMLTAKTWNEDVERAMTGGALDYVIKPFRASELLQTIERAF